MKKIKSLFSGTGFKNIYEFLEFLFILCLLLVIVFVLIQQDNRVKASIPTPQNATVERSGRLLQPDTESSWFTWNNELYYVFTDRPLDASSLQMKVVKFSDNSTISTFGVGYGFQDVIVDNNTLYVFADNPSGFGNTIQRFASTDLVNFTQTTVYSMPSDTKAFNLSITKNTDNNTFKLAYEYTTQSNGTFNIRFLTSNNLANWSTTGGTLTSSNCPDLIYSNGTYFMYVGTKLPDEITWLTSTAYLTTTQFGMYLTKSTDLTTWNYSSAYTLYPVTGHSFDQEDFHYTIGSNHYAVKNNTDFDTIEFQGKTYILYAIGDQHTQMYLTYATFDGTVAQLFNAYYK